MNPDLAHTEDTVANQYPPPSPSVSPHPLGLSSPRNDFLQLPVPLFLSQSSRVPGSIWTRAPFLIQNIQNPRPDRLDSPHTYAVPPLLSLERASEHFRHMQKKAKPQISTSDWARQPFELRPPFTTAYAHAHVRTSTLSHVSPVLRTLNREVMAWVNCRWWRP